MNQRNRAIGFCALYLALAGSVAVAADIDLELEAGIGQTDNITRATGTVADPTMDDIVYSAGIAMMLAHDSARADVDLRGSLFFHGFKDGPYDSQTLPALDLSAIFRITDQVLSWLFVGTIGQQYVDPFQPVTPDNQENITYLTTGPRLQFSMGPRFFLRTDLYYSEVLYEIQPSDNSRAGAQLSFVRQITPDRSLSLNLRGERTEFDMESLYAPIDRYDAFVHFETEGARNELIVDFGMSYIERLDDQAEEPLVNVQWLRRVSNQTSLDMTAGTRISDAAQNFRNVQQNSGEIGDIQNQQAVTNPFRENYAGISISVGATKTNFTLGGRWSDEDYPDDIQPQLDREILQYRADLSRQIGRSWVVGLAGRYESRDYKASARRDEPTNLGARLTWQQLRTVEIELRFDRFDQKSTEPDVEFVDNRIYLGFRYVPQIGR